MRQAQCNPENSLELLQRWAAVRNDSMRSGVGFVLKPLCSVGVPDTQLAINLLIYIAVRGLQVLKE